MSARTLCTLALAAVMGCAATRGGGGFELSYAPSSATELDAVAARVRNARPSVTPAVAVLVPPRPAEGFTVYGLPSGERLGQVSASIMGRPVVAGDLVLARVADAVVAYTFNGAERWRVPSYGYNLVGASQDGGRVALSLGGYGLSRRNGALVVADATSGAVVFAHREAHAFGVPCLVGDDVFLPWDGQNLSVFDARDGGERARIHGRSDLVGFARREGPSVWYGARALLRLSGHSAEARTAERQTFNVEGLPGSPPFMADPYTTLNAGLDARERVRLAWRPDAAGDATGFASNVVYSVFHRDVFGIDPTSGAPRWAWVHRADIAGVEAARDGIAVVDEDGQFVFVDAATGRVRWRHDLHASAAQAVIQVPYDFSPSGTVEEHAHDLVESLLLAAGGTDTRLMPAQLFAVRSLIALDSAEATHALVNVVTHRRFPEELRTAAAEAITQRRNGTSAMLEALEANYDYVNEVVEPPVGLLARGLAAHHDRAAVPALVGHLQDAATATTDLPAIIAALRELGDAAAVPALVDFVRLYHADVGAVPPVGGGDPIDERNVHELEPLEAALEQAVITIAALGQLNDRRVLAEVAIHPRTPRAVQEAIARSLRGDEGHTASTGSSGGTDMSFQAPPSRVTLEAIETAFFPERAALLDCLRGASSRPATVRITFRYDHTGAVSDPIINPATFQGCMAPIVTRVHLPESAVRREIGTFNLSTGP